MAKIIKDKLDTVIKRVTLSLNYKENKFIVITIILAAVLLTDNVISNVTDFLGNKQLSSTVGFIVFIVIFLAFCIGNYFILQFMRQSQNVKGSDPVNFLSRIIRTSQIIVGLIIVSIILQITIYSYYSLLSLVASTIISYAVAVSMMLLLSYKFFSWYKIQKDLMMLLYGISSLFLAVSQSLVTSFSIGVLFEKPANIFAYVEAAFPTFDPGLFYTYISNIYAYSDIISFFLIWFSNAILLYSHSRTIGKAKYWLLYSIPLLYFLNTYAKTFNLYNPSSTSEQFWYYIFESFNSTAGGILFAAIFLTIRKKMNSVKIKSYLSIAGFGFLLFYICNQATVISAAYPPFGISSVSFLGLSAFMIFIGIYSLAISITQDFKIKQFVYNSLNESDLKFLNSISEAEKNKRIESIFIKVAEASNNIERESGIKSSLTNKEIRTFMQTIIDEKIKKTK